jgi:uncharacterized membrane protein (UPF0127 family)
MRILFIGFISFLWLQGVASTSGAYGSAFNSSVEPPLSTMVVSFGRSTLKVEVASTAIQRQVGLMNRTKLDLNCGMMFLMPRIGPASFWMKDTLIPLSIAYLDRDGKIVEMEDKKPLNTAITHTKSNKIAYVLEANLHWFALHHIEAGDKISPSPNTWSVTATP